MADIDESEVSRQLASAKPTTIAELNPDLADTSSRSVHGVITIVWPYNSVKKSISFILAEPDFRLRRSNGQVRVNFSGACAKAIAESGLGSNDEVLLSLSNCAWEREGSKGRPSLPGAGIQWQLDFTDKATLQVKLGDTGDTKIIQAEHATPEVSIELPSVEDSTASRASPDLPATPSLADDLPAIEPVNRKRNDGEFASPAFIKRARVSYGSLFEGGFDMFDEDGGVRGGGRKRSRFGRASGAWRYSSQTPSPEPVGVDEDEQTTEPPPSTSGRTEDTPTRPAMTDEGSQTLEADVPSLPEPATTPTPSRFQFSIPSDSGASHDVHSAINGWPSIPGPVPSYASTGTTGDQDRTQAFSPHMELGVSMGPATGPWEPETLPYSTEAYPELPTTTSGLDHDLAVPQLSEHEMLRDMSRFHGVSTPSPFVQPPPQSIGETEFIGEEYGNVPIPDGTVNYPPLDVAEIPQPLEAGYETQSHYPEAMLEDSNRPTSSAERESETSAQDSSLSRERSPHVAHVPWATVNHPTEVGSRPLTDRFGSADGTTPEAAMVIDESDSEDDLEEPSAPIPAEDTVDQGRADLLDQYVDAEYEDEVDAENSDDDEPEYDADEMGGDYDARNYLKPADDEDDSHDEDLRDRPLQLELENTEAADSWAEEDDGEEEDEADDYDDEEDEQEYAEDSGVAVGTNQTASSSAADVIDLISSSEDEDEDEIEDEDEDDVASPTPAPNVGASHRVPGRPPAAPLFAPKSSNAESESEDEEEIEDDPDADDSQVEDVDDGGEVIEEELEDDDEEEEEEEEDNEREDEMDEEVTEEDDEDEAEGDEDLDGEALEQIIPASKEAKADEGVSAEYQRDLEMEMAENTHDETTLLGTGTGIEAKPGGPAFENKEHDVTEALPGDTEITTEQHGSHLLSEHEEVADDDVHKEYDIPQHEAAALPVPEQFELSDPKEPELEDVDMIQVPGFDSNGRISDARPTGEAAQTTSAPESISLMQENAEEGSKSRTMLPSSPPLTQSFQSQQDATLDRSEIEDLEMAMDVQTKQLPTPFDTQQTETHETQQSVSLSEPDVDVVQSRDQNAPTLEQPEAMDVDSEPVRERVPDVPALEELVDLAQAQPQETMTSSQPVEAEDAPASTPVVETSKEAHISERSEQPNTSELEPFGVPEAPTPAEIREEVDIAANLGSGDVKESMETIQATQVMSENTTSAEETQNTQVEQDLGQSKMVVPEIRISEELEEEEEAEDESPANASFQSQVDDDDTLQAILLLENSQEIEEEDLMRLRAQAHTGLDGATEPTTASEATVRVDESLPITEHNEPSQVMSAGPETRLRSSTLRRGGTGKSQALESAASEKPQQGLDAPDPSTELAKAAPMAKRQSRRREATPDGQQDTSVQPAKAATTSKRSSKANEASPEAARPHTRSQDVHRSTTPETNTESAEPAKPELLSSPKVDEEGNSFKDSHMRLLRHMRDELPGYTTLKVLRYHLTQNLDIIAMVMMQPPEPRRAKGGPREYMMSFTITDYTVPSSVVEVQLYRPHKESLPIVKVGDIILLRNFTVVSLKNKGVGLRTNESSSWAVFDRPDEPAQIKGPPVEYGEAETAGVAHMREWFEQLDDKAKDKLEKANRKIIDAGKA